MVNGKLLNCSGQKPMNFLAHIYLSGDHPDILLGNFMADQIKGRDLSNYSESVRIGIQLHRGIDHFTDTSEINKLCRDLIRPTMGKYAGVVLDVFYDHFLAKNWNSHHSIELNEFVSSTYDFIESRKHEMPPRTQDLFQYMQKQNWLSNYAHIEGIERALIGLSRRAKHGEQMANSKAELINNYDEINDKFDEFFPLIKDFCRDFLLENKVGP